MSCNVAEFSRAFQKHTKGASLTRVRASSTWRALARFAKEKKMILSPDKMTSKQLMRFVEYRIEAGISARSIQNEVSHIRRSLEGSGRDLGDLKDKTNNWSGHRLKVPAGSRIGGKAPADKSAVDLVSRDDIRAAFGLQAAIGLRMREAIQAGPSLRMWERELVHASSLGRGAFLRVTEGTKGGRPRSVWLAPEQIPGVLKAVKEASGQSVNGRLIKAQSLAAAVRACGRSALEAGFETHGLRRAWAVEQFTRYVQEGQDKTQALKLLSNDLGHGDGRGRWVMNNYLLGALNDREG